MVYIWDLDPIALSLGPIEIRWYGVMYAIGFLIVYAYLRRAVREGRAPLSMDDVDRLLTYLVVGMIAGARIAEVLIYEPGYYFANPAEIIAIWHGGLSFHGALAGMLLAGYLFARKRKVSLLKLADLVIVPVSIAQSFGRFGNFINGELFGRPTDLPWGVIFPNAEGPRHPSQLYEAFYNVIIFAVLYSQRNKKWPDGSLFALFLVLYAVFRGITEFFRQPDFVVGPLTSGQLLNIPMLIGGIALWYYVRRKAAGNSTTS